MATAIGQGWLLGLSAGAWCLGACAPVLLPYLVSCGPAGWRVSGRQMAAFMAGRLLAYLLLGLLVAGLGDRFRASPAYRALVGAVMVILAVLLLVHGVSRSWPEWRPCRSCAQSGLRGIPLVAGFVLGLTPCPPMLLAVTELLTGRGPVAALAFWSVFFLATSLWLMPVMAVGALGRREQVRGVAEVAVLFSGLWFGVRGACLMAGSG